MSTLMEQTGALGHRVFAGKLDKAELGRLERTMVRAVRAPEGDYRDWDDIAAWAARIADESLGACSRFADSRGQHRPSSSELGTTAPAAPAPPEKAWSCAEGAVMKVLVTAASRHGSTEDVAAAIAQGAASSWAGRGGCATGGR